VSESGSPFERYKAALRRGHVAAQRGRLDAAAAAYREATGIAPDRSLPLVGLGGVLARLGRSEDALTAYASALDRAPADESALRGRAAVFSTLGRRSDAADALDRLVAVLDGEGRIADACDAARMALEAAESRGRRRQLQASADRLTAVAPDDPIAAEARKRALAILGPVTVATDAGATGAGTTDGTPTPDAAGAAPDPLLLTMAVEEALEAGDLDEARRRALTAAIGHRAAGQFHAAMDACYQALAILPSDPDIHLLLAELYLDRGWRGPAADKLVLLGRLSQLTGDHATRGRLCYLAAARFPDDPRLAAVCA